VIDEVDETDEADETGEGGEESHLTIAVHENPILACVVAVVAAYGHLVAMWAMAEHR